jgi:hypothetical protein
MFDVGAGVINEVDLMLRCKGAEEFGGVRINGKLNVCAEIQKVVVKPLQTSNGYGLSVEAEASDTEGDPVEYSWTATGGSFDDPDAMKTVFVCGEPGLEVVTIEVSDDDFKHCIDDWNVNVNCVGNDGAGGTGGGGGAGGDSGSGGGSGSGGDSGSGGGSGGSGGGSGGGGDTGGGGSGSGGSGSGPPQCLVTLSVQ